MPRDTLAGFEAGPDSNNPIDEIVRLVEVYLSGRLRAADWRLSLRHRQQAE